MAVVQGINKLEQLPRFYLIWELMFDIMDAGFHETILFNVSNSRDTVSRIELVSLYKTYASNR